LGDEAQMELLLTVELGHLSKRSCSGAARKGWGQWPEFLFIDDNPKSGGVRRCCKRTIEKTLTRKQENKCEVEKRLTEKVE
jgi:hypothetical protein